MTNNSRHPALFSSYVGSYQYGYLSEGALAGHLEPGTHSRIAETETRRLELEEDLQNIDSQR